MLLVSAVAVRLLETGHARLLREDRVRMRAAKKDVEATRRRAEWTLDRHHVSRKLLGTRKRSASTPLALTLAVHHGRRHASAWSRDSQVPVRRSWAATEPSMPSDSIRPKASCVAPLVLAGWPGWLWPVPVRWEAICSVCELMSCDQGGTSSRG